MKAYVVFSSREPALIVTRHTIRNEAVLKQLDRVGIRKFIAREVPIGHLRNRYGFQFDVIEKALEEGTDLRVLDFSGHRIFQNLPFSEFGPAYSHDYPLKRPESVGERSRTPSRPYSASASSSFFG